MLGGRAAAARSRSSPPPPPQAQNTPAGPLSIPAAEAAGAAPRLTLPRGSTPSQHILSAYSVASSSAQTTTSSKASSSKNGFKSLLSRVFGRKTRSLGSDPGTEELGKGGGGRECVGNGGKAGLGANEQSVTCPARNSDVETTTMARHGLVKHTRSLKKMRLSTPSESPAVDSTGPPTSSRTLKHARSEPALKYLAKSQQQPQLLMPPPILPPLPVAQPTHTSSTSSSSNSNHSSANRSARRSAAKSGSTGCIRLLDIHPDGRLKLQRDAVEHLRRVDAHVIVLAAFGPVGVGKSCVLNRVARNRCKFGSEPALEAAEDHVKCVSMAIVDPWWDLPQAGLDANRTPLPKRKMKVVLIDAPGVTGDEQQLAWESRLVALVTLLASTLFVIGRTRMRSRDLAVLFALGELPSLIHPSTTLDALTITLPSIQWLLLDADDPSGKTDPHMLEDLLHPTQADDSDDDTYLAQSHATPPVNAASQRVRAVLTKLFRRHALHSLAAPPAAAAAAADPTALDSAMAMEGARHPPPSAYRTGMEKLSNTVALAAEVKRIAGPRPDEPSVSLKGADLANLVTALCEMLNKDQPAMDLDRTWSHINDEDLMTAIAVPAMPLDLVRLADRHDECARKALAALRDQFDDGDSQSARSWRRKQADLAVCIGDLDDMGQVEPPDAFLAAFINKNYEIALAKCMGILSRGQDGMNKKIADGHYESLSVFDHDASRLIASFHRAARSPADLIHPSTIAAHVLTFQQQVAAQRAVLGQHLADRLQQHVLRQERERANWDRYQRELAVRHAEDELRGVQELIGGVRWRAGEQERMLRETERVARERLMSVVMAGGAGASSSTAIYIAPPSMRIAPTGGSLERVSRGRPRSKSSGMRGNKASHQHLTINTTAAPPSSFPTGTPRQTRTPPPPQSLPSPNTSDSHYHHHHHKHHAPPPPRPIRSKSASSRLADPRQYLYHHPASAPPIDFSTGRKMGGGQGQGQYYFSHPHSPPPVPALPVLYHTAAAAAAASSAAAGDPYAHPAAMMWPRVDRF
ncbi:hypothetical protein HDU87_006868 [Geranomyces variabilis]|uniref:Guanylate-binding protein N-terminal domain-containing protein n=1 Tax=Geranomyces variabilis TaxID=109894 RepID=A0AAD5TS55_9FUNG|nr:hypothetical protein HDU87_006868 [Geranomyces variabilis]